MKQRAKKLALALGILALSGCAGMQMKVKTSSGAVIPVDYIDKVVAASPDTVCKMLPDPRLFKCTGTFWIEAHGWKVVKKDK